MVRSGDKGLMTQKMLLYIYIYIYTHTHTHTHKYTLQKMVLDAISIIKYGSRVSGAI